MSESCLRGPRESKLSCSLAWRMIFSVTVFIGAFLLFQIQPMIGKMILPRFGGSSSVWTTCLVFFQSGLLIGYAYAHLLRLCLSPALQVFLHALLLFLSCLVLPISIPEIDVAASAEMPTSSIIWVLTVSVGLPYIVLASTAPLVQSWYSNCYSTSSVYRLYALSNTGSMLGLFSYPFLFEPNLLLKTQSLQWTYLFYCFAGFCALCAVFSNLRAGHAAARETANENPPGKMTRAAVWLWFLFPAAGSIMLVSLTNHVTQDVAPIPLLWVVPLGLYLLTFILCFDSDKWYSRTRFFPPLLLFLVLLFTPKFTGSAASIYVALFICFSTLFFFCMLCHGELAALRPHTRFLTSYYLWLSAGGAAGGIFVGLVAPMIFTGFFELHCAIVLGGALLLIRCYLDPSSVLYRARYKRSFAYASSIYAVMILIVALNAVYSVRAYKWMGRNFYGPLRTIEYNKADPKRRLLAFYHGRILHGAQFLDPSRRREPVFYYGPETGINFILSRFGGEQPRRIGILGLGAGGLLVYGKPGDYIKVYEINPMVIERAKQDFTYLKDAKCPVEIVLGDGRLALAKEEPNNFDIIVADAFSGDSVPVHLLTKEATQLYLTHLKADGILVFHVSNRHLALRPVVFSIAEALGWPAYFASNKQDLSRSRLRSDWVFLTKNSSFVEQSGIKSIIRDYPFSGDFSVWTDDYSSLYQVLRW